MRHPRKCFVEPLTLITLVLNLASQCGAQQARQNPSGPIFWIVYERIDTPALASTRFPYVDIFLMDENGRQAKSLTSNHRSHNPTWSPDGRQIAFLSEERSPVAPNTTDEGYNEFLEYRDFLTIPRDVVRIDVESRDSHRVGSAGVDAQGLVWFPDGNRLGIRISDRSALRVLVDSSGRFPPDGQRTETLKQYLDKGTPLPGGGYSPNYLTLMEWVPPANNFVPTFVASNSFRDRRNPDLLKAVQSTANFGSLLRVMSLGGDFETFPLAAYDLAWSMDGRHVAYSAFSDESKSTLYVAETQNGQIEPNRQPVTDETLDAHGPAWSLHGLRIVFMGLWKGTSQLFAIGFDGSNLIQISRDPKMSCYHPSWSPDGRWIVADCRQNVTVMRPLTNEVGGLTNIFLFDIAKPGSKPRQLTRCSHMNPLSLPTCGARNPSFAPTLIPRVAHP